MMEKRLNARPVPVQIPWGAADEFVGIVDIIRMKALVWDENDPRGVRFDEVDIPEELLEAANAAREKLVEAVCEVSDDLLAKYLAEQPLSPEEIRAAVRQGTCDLRFTPVLTGSAFRQKGVQPLLDGIIDFMPSPSDVTAIEGINPDDDSTVIREASDDAPFSALVFKIVSDPFVGQLAYIRVYSGSLKSGEHVFLPSRRSRQRIGRLLKMHANKREEIKELWAGDIAAVVGLRNVSTGDTICDEKAPVLLESMDFPEPVIRLAIEPKTKADQEKLSTALAKLVQEDPTFRVQTDPDTGQTLIAGMGELHLEILVDRLKREFKVEAGVGKPQVAYRETIRRAAEAEGRYIRQTGGRGQYGHVKIKIEPSGSDAGFEFESKIVGGSIPKEYISSIKSGIEEALEMGVLAGYAMRDIKVQLIDGSHHDVDSSEMAFKIAGSMAFKEAARRADAVLLEPVMKVEIVVREEYMGDVIADLNSRRGRIQNMEARPGIQTIQAVVPLAELFGYATDLRSATQGRGNYTMHFSHYDEVPKSIGEEVIARVCGTTRR
jgi:elongation factor G